MSRERRDILRKTYGVFFVLESVDEEVNDSHTVVASRLNIAFSSFCSLFLKSKLSTVISPGRMLLAPLLTSQKP